ncbi:hypothetical protein OAN78_06040 [Gammaproteobacteria bacterium]|nr:hypothetical protein [Gammaproteobacteria bacterium]
MMALKSKFFFAIALATLSNFSLSQIYQSKGSFEDKFRQLDEVFPSPNLNRPATGEPGPSYWQQRADYKIKIKLDEESRSVQGSEVITYTNNSPLKLNYVWLQLDQNIFEKDSINNLTRPWWGENKSVDFSTLRRQNFMDTFDGGFQELLIKINGTEAQVNLVGTHVRINLDAPLNTGESIELEIDWAYALVEENAVRARNGYESFEDGDKELVRIPVEIWRKNPNKTRWLKRSKLEITQAVIDPYWEIGDTEIENNYYPSRLIPARLKPRASRSNPKNLMKDLLKRNEKISSHQ